MSHPCQLGHGVGVVRRHRRVDVPRTHTPDLRRGCVSGTTKVFWTDAPTPDTPSGTRQTHATGDRTSRKRKQLVDTTRSGRPVFYPSYPDGTSPGSRSTPEVRSLTTTQIMFTNHLSSTWCIDQSKRRTLSVHCPPSLGTTGQTLRTSPPPRTSPSVSLTRRRGRGLGPGDLRF